MSRPTNLLTDKKVQSAKFEKLGKRTKLADGVGLYLDIQPSGKYWRMKYRFNGKEKTLALGVYPDVSLKLARELRTDARKLIADGIDPNEIKKEKKAARKEQADTFKAVADDWLKLKKGGTCRLGKLLKTIDVYGGHASTRAALKWRRCCSFDRANCETRNGTRLTWTKLHGSFKESG